MTSVEQSARPRLAPKVRLWWDEKSRKYVLVYPERALVLNEVAAFIVSRCDGTSTANDIARALSEEFEGAPDDTPDVVMKLLGEFAARGLVLGVTAVRDDAFSKEGFTAPRPFTLICELSYRCPLRCAYCSNPLDLRRHKEELSTEDWLRILTQAKELGALQVHLTGGEPLVRDDLETLVAHCRSLGFFTNLVTSGLPRDDARLERLCALGLDNVQVSIQDTDDAGALTISGKAALADKIAAARIVKNAGLPLTLNVVLHRHNIDRTPAFLELGKKLAADRIELANTQYLGWALLNKEQLLPTREQVDTAFALSTQAKKELLGKAEVLFVKPDHFGTYPRACMDGWARRFLHVSPDGMILPCHAAMSIEGLAFPNAKTSSLDDAWNRSAAFAAFRGDAWMKEPCATCDRKTQDFGGCRCQAFALTGDADATDPACTLSPAHALISELVASKRPHMAASPAPIVLRHHRGVSKG
ncbi:MAG: pyrroloquinoline quinone biosynthesis protein PqqE [Polyangiaceae bacterium]